MTTPSRALVFLAACAALLTMVGCGASSGTGGGAGDGPTVVATTTQLADFARNVVGTDGRVVQLLPANADAHDFEPTSDDLKAVSRADVIIANGLHLDDWIRDLRSSAGSSAPLVIASDGIATRTAGAGAGGGGDGAHAVDPHIWMDPANAITMVTTIERAIAAAAPDHRTAYAADADAYRAKLTALGRRLQAMIDTVPAARRTIVTDHDAFGYLTSRYGITTVGTILPSLSTSAEPSAQGLARLSDDIRRAGVRVVFPEAAISPRLSQALAAETGARVGPVLYADSLGPAGSGADTYIGMMTTDMSALVAGMRG